MRFHLRTILVAEFVSPYRSRLPAEAATPRARLRDCDVQTGGSQPEEAQVVPGYSEYSTAGALLKSSNGAISSPRPACIISLACLRLSARTVTCSSKAGSPPVLLRRALVPRRIDLSSQANGAISDIALTPNMCIQDMVFSRGIQHREEEQRDAGG